jgi:hypothetical protein
MIDEEDVVYPGCFLGSEAIKWMVDEECCPVTSVEVSSILSTSLLLRQMKFSSTPL